MALQGRRDAGAGRDSRRVREEEVEVCDGIVVDCSSVHGSAPVSNSSSCLAPEPGGGAGADRLDAFNLPESRDRCSAMRVVAMAATVECDSDGTRTVAMTTAATWQSHGSSVLLFGCKDQGVVVVVV